MLKSLVLVTMWLIYSGLLFSFVVGCFGGAFGGPDHPPKRTESILHESAKNNYFCQIFEDYCPL